MIIYLLERALKLMKKAPVDGCFVEFGVYQGYSLVQTIKLTKKYLGENIDFYGFDSFEGMPTTTQPLNETLDREWGPGTFANTSLERVKKLLKREHLEARLIKGVFSEFKPLSEYGINKIRFAHIDADIYEGYRDALKKITPFVQVGTVIIFDEYCAPSDFRYQNMRYHGPKAIDEWVKETGFNLHLIRFEWTCGLCVIVDEQYLRRYGSYIESLRNDNMVQTFMDLLRQISARLNI